MFGVLFLAVVCVCSCASLPANGRRQEDITQLVTLLGKLKNIERVRQQQYQHNHHLSKQHQQLLSGISLSSKHSPASASGLVPLGEKLALSALASGTSSASQFPAEVLTSPDDTNSLLLGDDLDLDLTGDNDAERSNGGSGRISESKRQGAWSYDYGLGGGRFGKRSYGDYGIGGGRFGRDVDHVDTNDADDSTL